MISVLNSISFIQSIASNKNIEIRKEPSSLAIYLYTATKKRRILGIYIKLSFNWTILGVGEFFFLCMETCGSAKSRPKV